jgi:hypothetical protein
MSSRCAKAAAGSTTPAEQLLEALREAVNMRDAWAKIAGLQPDEASQADDEGDETIFRQAG